jgi:diguanylate cyclase (GGDEF)-like protein
VVARLGGDEFALVLPNTGEFTTLQITRKLHQKLDSIVKENKWPVTFSIGIGIFPIVPGDLDHVITFSDSLMYQAKIEGKNKIVHRGLQSWEGTGREFSRLIGSAIFLLS